VPSVRWVAGGVDRRAARRRRHAHAHDRLAARLLAHRAADQPVARLSRRPGAAGSLVGPGRRAGDRGDHAAHPRARAALAAARAAGDRRSAGAGAGARMTRAALLAALLISNWAPRAGAAAWTRSTPGAGGAFTQASADGDTVWVAADIAGF